jgi:hypothetical protein
VERVIADHRAKTEILFSPLDFQFKRDKEIAFSLKRVNLNLG